MPTNHRNRRQWSWFVFISIFSLTLALFVGARMAAPAFAAPHSAPLFQDETPEPTQAPQTLQGGTYAGSAACAKCHPDIHTNWTSTRHSQAFSSPIFQRDWSQLAKQTSCLECHTTGFNEKDGTYSEEGVTCESCHEPFQPEHPAQSMPLTPNADLCSRCHKSTTDEWRASPHNKAGIQCQSCHNPHSQTPMADSVTALCSNCHKERGGTFAHSTHSNSGLECSNCHMYTAPRTEDPIGGLVSTGHTFAVGSEACIGCHQDTVHTRDEIVKLSGEVAAQQPKVDTKALEVKLQEQEKAITELQTTSSVRLYTGLAQGAIVGLITGGVAAWIVSRRIRVVEEAENE